MIVCVRVCDRIDNSKLNQGIYIENVNTMKIESSYRIHIDLYLCVYTLSPTNQIWRRGYTFWDPCFNFMHCYQLSDFSEHMSLTHLCYFSHLDEP